MVHYASALIQHAAGAHSSGNTEAVSQPPHSQTKGTIDHVYYNSIYLHRRYCMMRSVATSYITSGYLPIPIPLKTKAPILKNWTTVRVTEDNVGEYFDSEESNIG